jgi:hypothetical protein
MKKILFLSLLLSFTIYSQENFVEGKFILNNKTDLFCKIDKNFNKNNLSHVEYKINDTLKKMYSNDFTQLEIFGISKFKKVNVEADLIYVNTDILDYNRILTKKSIELFLQIIYESENYTLLTYSKNSKNIFFIEKKSENTIEQLNYKRYLTQNNDVAENLTYIDQLNSLQKCQEFQMSRKAIRYNSKDLIYYFSNVVDCNNENVTFIKKEKEVKWVFGVGYGYGFTSQKLNNNSREIFIDYGKLATHNIFLKSEIIFPALNYGLSLYGEIHYLNYSGVESVQTSLLNRNEYSLNVNYLNFNIGPKIYILNKYKIKPHLETLIVLNLSRLNSGLVEKIYTSSTVYNNTEFELNKTINFQFGGGVQMSNFDLSIRFFPRDMLENSISWSAKSFQTSMIVSYMF